MRLLALRGLHFAKKTGLDGIEVLRVVPEEQLRWPNDPTKKVWHHKKIGNSNEFGLRGPFLQNHVQTQVLLYIYNGSTHPQTHFFLEQYHEKTGASVINDKYSPIIKCCVAKTPKHIHT